jgi:hypothetical protein
MNINEKLDMYREKDSFVRRLDLALTTPTPRGMSIYGIEYEVYQKEPGSSWFQEFIILTFEGGEICPINVKGNSNVANLCEIAKNIANPEFPSFPMYQKVKETWIKVDLD